LSFILSATILFCLNVLDGTITARTNPLITEIILRLIGRRELHRSKGYLEAKIEEGARKGEEKKSRERGKAHRRLTRIYSFVGIANKESARETGFLRTTHSSTSRILVAVESTKTLDPRDISDIVARVNGQREKRIYGHARLHELRICARQDEET